MTKAEEYFRQDNPDCLGIQKMDRINRIKKNRVLEYWSDAT
jgi:hypothetical protein